MRNEARRIATDIAQPQQLRQLKPRGIIANRTGEPPRRPKRVRAMNERIEAFLQDVLALEGEIWNLIRGGVRRYLAVYEKQFRDDETNKRMKDKALRFATRYAARAWPGRYGGAREHRLPNT